MTVSTFYPDADPETNSVDGEVRRDVTAGSWADTHDGVGQSSNGSNDVMTPNVGTNGSSLFRMTRAILLFNTGPTLPDGDTIDSATLEFVCVIGGRVNDFAEAGSLSLGTSNPASNIGVANSDFNIGNWPAHVDQATPLMLAGLTVDSATYNVFTLNATGWGNISKTGVSKFGIRLKHDADNTSPTAAADKNMQASLASAEELLAGDKRPKLVVTHTAPPATFTPKMVVF